MSSEKRSRSMLCISSKEGKVSKRRRQACDENDQIEVEKLLNFQSVDAY